MACDDPYFCLGDHIRPRLDDCTQNRDKAGQWTARCPAHDDQKPSLSIRVGDRGAIIWHCHARCSAAEVRAALIRRGVPDSCLRRVAEQRTEDELVSALTGILEAEPPGRYRDLLIAAVVWNRAKMPRGQALAKLADRAGISRTAAYRAKTEREREIPPWDERIIPRTHTSPTMGFRVRGLTSEVRRSRSVMVRTSVEDEAPGQCAYCERQLTSARSGTRYCSNSCRARAWRDRRDSADPPGTGRLREWPVNDPAVVTVCVCEAKSGGEPAFWLVRTGIACRVVWMVPLRRPGILFFTTAGSAASRTRKRWAPGLPAGAQEG